MLDGSWLEAVSFAVFVGVAALAMARNRRTDGKTHPLRAWLRSFLASRPGLPVHAISKSAGVTRRTVEHHLEVLEWCGDAFGLREAGVHGYFLARTPLDAAQSILLLRRGRVLELVSYAAKTPGRTQTDVTAGLGMGRRVLRVYVDLLVGAGLLEERRVGARRLYYPTPRLLRILPLLEDAPMPAPPPPGRPAPRPPEEWRK
ncbi:MAG: hypothetical protein HYT80_08390 [Euryarchaeota archaeon]|nr:hypothetical protein [Euryarchaeota archaeon]